MTGWSLRSKMIASVGLIIFVVLGTSTLIHIQFLRRNYLQSIEWRSEALAQGIVNEIVDLYQFIAYMPGMLEGVALRCQQLYASNRDKNVTHVAVIDPSGIFAVHSDPERAKTPVQNPLLLEYLERQEQTTVLVGSVYHTLVPVFGTEENRYLGTVDIGFPKQAVDAKVNYMLITSVKLFGLFLVLAFFTISVLMHVLLTKPVKRLVDVGQRMADGYLVQTLHTGGRGDEISILSSVFNRIAHYLQQVAEVASHVSTGDLEQEVRVRSEHDVLGQAIRDMLYYLQHVAAVARQIADGDLRAAIQVRSATDAFGQTIQSMLEGLRSLIVRIRASADQIAATEKTIASLSEHDIAIVAEVQDSAKTMTSTLHGMGDSIEDVARNTEMLSASASETSASMTQITSSITHIASHTTQLTQQTHKTVEYLQDAVSTLEQVGQHTEISKQLTGQTIDDARSGEQAVEQVMHSMETMQQTMTSAVKNITRFAERSQDIDTILEVIRNITEQSSLLALNASIIAAQAGVHGRGFAVVADEIRDLAEGVKGSTTDIAGIVSTLQQETRQVVETIHAEAQNVEQGLTRTQQARETLQKIISSAESSSTVVTDIAESVNNLINASQNVFQAMEQVNVMTDDITTATQQHQDSTRLINQAIAHIDEMASHIQQAAAEQHRGVLQVIENMNRVTQRIDSNMESSRQITLTTQELSRQAALLLESVDRFKL